MEPLAPHEKILVDSKILEDENHGEMACVDCHGGNPDDPNWKTAHEGVVVPVNLIPRKQKWQPK